MGWLPARTGLRLHSKLQGNVCAAGSHVSDPKGSPGDVNDKKKHAACTGMNSGHWQVEPGLPRAGGQPRRWAHGARLPGSYRRQGSAARRAQHREAGQPGPGARPSPPLPGRPHPKTKQKGTAPLSEKIAPGSCPPGSETGPWPTLPPRDPPRERLAVSGAPLAQWLPMPTRTPGSAPGGSGRSLARGDSAASFPRDTREPAGETKSWRARASRPGDGRRRLRQRLGLGDGSPFAPPAWARSGPGR